MSEAASSAKFSVVLVEITEVRPATYSLEAAADLAGMHPEMLRYYCRLGLLGEARAQPETVLMFDDNALFELRRVEHYRQQHGINRKTLRLIWGLSREVERLQNEIRFLRGP